MAKNLVIVILAIVIACLVGIVIFTNYSWFSEEWSIGLAVIIGSVAAIGILTYYKIQNS